MFTGLLIPLMSAKTYLCWVFVLIPLADAPMMNHSVSAQGIPS
jgi:hypothetical protein